MVVVFENLPIELIHLTLQFLPIPDLLSFARTSKRNHNLSRRVLTTLDLAVFPRRIHSLLAFFDASNEDEDQDDDDDEDPQDLKYWPRRSASDEPLHQIGLITPNANRPSLSRSITPPSSTSISPRRRKTPNRDSTPSSSSTATPSLDSPTPSIPTSRSISQSRTRPNPVVLRAHEITTQNEIATKVLQTPTLSNIQTLTLRLYDLSCPTLTHTLAQFSNLTSLNLDLCHPYIHDTILPARYWRETPNTGSPIWNSLAGLGDAQNQDLKLRNLKYLKLNRSGITSVQLRNWIQRNPDLRELRLALCRGVDSEFVEWFGNHVASLSTSTHSSSSTLSYASHNPPAHPKSALSKVSFIDCSHLNLQHSTSFTWVDHLIDSGIQELSFSGCRNVNEDLLLELAKTWVERSHAPLRIVSVKGVVVRKRREREVDGGFAMRVSSGKGKGIEKRRGDVSPALTVSDGVIGSASGIGALAKIEVDPDLVGL